MAVFSRCAAVLEADDRRVTVKAALQLINAELDAALQGDLDKESRFAVSWFEQYGYGKGDFGIADNLARAYDLSVAEVQRAGIAESVAGKLRILRRDELDAEWDPAKDKHLTVWKCCQQLIRALDEGGETAAARLIGQLGDAEAARQLAYALYDLCTHKRPDAAEAGCYNRLIAGWMDIQLRLVQLTRTQDPDQQTTMDI